MLDHLIALVGRIRPSGDLTSQTIISTLWSAGINVGTRVLRLLTTVIVGNILGPETFGLMSIGLIVHQGLKRFSRTGIDRALIQRPDSDVTHYLDTAWTVQVVRGIVIGVILFASAPLVAVVFDEPQVTPILRVIALSPPLLALCNPSIVYFEKDLDMHKKFGYDISGAGAEFLVAVPLALAYENVWALVFGFLAADVARVIVSYALHDYRPSLGADFGQVRELVGYGKWITATSAITFLLVSGDDAVVGALLSTTALGLYQMGYRLGKTPTMEVSSTLSTVVFPLYSKLQDDAEALAGALQRTVRLLSLVSFPAAVGVALTARPFVEFALGAEWAPIVPVVQIAAVYGAFSSFTSAFNDVWNAIGRPDYNTKLNVLRLVVTAVIIYPATVTYNITGAVAAVAGVFILLIVPLKTHMVIESVETSHRQLLSELLYPAVASLLMGVVLLPLRETLSTFPAPVAFAVLVVAGVATYGAAVGLIDSWSTWGIREEFRTIIGSIGG